METIELNKTYSLNEIVRKKLIPFIKSYQTAKTAVLEDAAKPKKDQLLKAQIIGEGRARTIRIKGADLQSFIEAKQHNY